MDSNKQMFPAYRILMKLDCRAAKSKRQCLRLREKKEDEDAVRANQHARL